MIQYKVQYYALSTLHFRAIRKVLCLMYFLQLVIRTIRTDIWYYRPILTFQHATIDLSDRLLIERFFISCTRVPTAFKRAGRVWYLLSDNVVRSHAQLISISSEHKVLLEFEWKYCLNLFYMLPDYSIKYLVLSLFLSSIYYPK